MKAVKKTWLAAMLACCVMGQMARLAGAEGLAERSPPDTMACAEWAGTDALGQAYNGSHLKGFLEALKLPELFHDRMMADLEKKPAAEKEKGKVAVEWLSEMMKYPTAVCVQPFDMAAIPKNPPAHISIYARMGKEKAEAIAGKLDAAINSNNGPNEPPHGAKAVGEYLLVWIGDDNFSDRLTGNPAAYNLTTTTGYKNAMKQLGPAAQSPAVLAYVDGNGVGRQLQTSMQNQPIGVQAANALLDGLGLMGVHEAAWAGSFDGADWQSATFVGMKERRNGLLAFLDNPALSDTAYKLIPKSATWAWISRFDGDRFMTDIQDIAAAMDPTGAQKLETGLQQFYFFTGLELKRDLMPSMGTEFIYYATPDAAGNSIRGITVVNKLKDPKKAETAFSAIESFASLMILQRDPATKITFTQQRLEAPLDKVTAHVINLGEVAPAWAISGDLFVMSVSVQGLYSALERAGKEKQPSILDNPQFAALSKKLGRDAMSSFHYQDLPAALPETYELVNQGLMKAKQTRPEEKTITLPPLEKLKGHVAPRLSAYWSDETGFHGRETGPFPLAEFLNPVQLILVHVMGEAQKNEAAPRGEGQALP